MTQEFYISVTPVREDEYWIRTERVSPGVPLAEELVTWSVDDWLAQAGQLMHDPLLGLLRGHFPGRSTSRRSGRILPFSQPVDIRANSLQRSISRHHSR